MQSSESGAGRTGGGVAEAAGAPELSERVRNDVTFQEYGPTPRIAGVRLVPLTKHRSENGSFAELMRLDASGRVSLDGGDFQVRQLSVSHAAPGRLNAFHIHPRLPQNELWSVVEGQLMVWLVDCRADSATADVRQRVVLSAEQPALLHIPAGIAHGYRAGPEGALLVYAMDQQFDPDRPNEGRLPWNHFGSELWEEDRG